MTDHSYLLFIDTKTIQNDLKEYFIQFNIEIIQQHHVCPLSKNAKIPLAILINWSVLQRNPQTFTDLYPTHSIPLFIIHEEPNEEVCSLVLESGADDFLIQPLHARELHARIGAISRRIVRNQKKITMKKNTIQFANWRLNPLSRQLFDENNSELQLSNGEYELLYIFIQQPQCILEREFLLHIMKYKNHDKCDRCLDVQISRLRQKIERNAKEPALIKTIRNAGYMFTSAVSVCADCE